jgi:hypothetical protein
LAFLGDPDIQKKRNKNLWEFDTVQTRINFFSSVIYIYMYKAFFLSNKTKIRALFYVKVPAMPKMHAYFFIIYTNNNNSNDGDENNDSDAK